MTVFCISILSDSFMSSVSLNQFQVMGRVPLAVHTRETEREPFWLIESSKGEIILGGSMRKK